MITKNSDITTKFTGIDFSKYSSMTEKFVNEFASRANQKGQFLNWVNLPQEQLKRLDEIYSLAQKLKQQTSAKKLSVMGIGGSKHTVEHKLSIKGLKAKNESITVFSDVCSSSLERIFYRPGNDVTFFNYMIVV